MGHICAINGTCPPIAPRGGCATQPIARGEQTVFEVTSTQNFVGHSSPHTTFDEPQICLREKSSSYSALRTKCLMEKHRLDGTGGHSSFQLTHRYLPEAAHPYYVLKKNGYEIVFASPKGIRSITGNR